MKGAQSSLRSMFGMPGEDEISSITGRVDETHQETCERISGLADAIQALHEAITTSHRELMNANKQVLRALEAVAQGRPIPKGPRKYRMVRGDDGLTNEIHEVE